MTYRNESPTSNGSQICSAIVVDAPKLSKLIRLALYAVFAVFVLTTISVAAELPEAPSSAIRTSSAVIEVVVPAQHPGIVSSRETKMIDKKFLSLAFVSTGSTFADSYTTLFARQNWLAGKKGVCNVEVESAYLYGAHPTVGRAYAVASVKSLSSVFAAYYLRKHHNKFWSLPLVTNSVMSLQGVGQNMATCN
jgi:hypothetical protein